METNWQVLTDAHSVAETAHQQILHHAEHAIAQRGVFHLVLAGGSTPELCYQLLARSQTDWQHWQLYFGDERCLPATDSARNSHMAQRTWLQPSQFPASQCHPIPAELGARAAAAQYAQTIQPALPFDLVLLGMGEDGHTASLFPGHEVSTTHLTQAVFDAPKPPPERVSLTPLALQQSRALLFLITGASKCDALHRWQAGEDLPAAHISRLAPARILLDQAAGQGFS